MVTGNSRPTELGCLRAGKRKVYQEVSWRTDILVSQYNYIFTKFWDFRKSATISMIENEIYAFFRSDFPLHAKGMHDCRQELTCRPNVINLCDRV